MPRGFMGIRLERCKERVPLSARIAVTQPSGFTVRSGQGKVAVGNGNVEEQIG